MPHDDQIREQALAWAVRTGDPEFADWEGFTCWLEENPAHAARPVSAVHLPASRNGRKARPKGHFGQAARNAPP